MHIMDFQSVFSVLTGRSDGAYRIDCFTVIKIRHDGAFFNTWLIFHFLMKRETQKRLSIFFE